MKYILITIITLMPQIVIAKLGISGSWNCNVSVKSKDDFTLSYLIKVNDKETQFKRVGSILLKTGLPIFPYFKWSTLEEGTLTVNDNNILLTPLNTDFKIIKGKEFFESDSSEILEEINSEMLEKLLEDEHGEIEFINTQKYLMKITKEDSIQTNTCIKII